MKIGLILLFLTISAISFAENKNVSSLSEYEQNILEEGELTTTDILASGFLVTFFGLGIGHYNLNRYSKGKKFTFGQVGSVLVTATGLIVTVSNKRENTARKIGVTMMTSGLIGIVVFRVWELVDLWTIIFRHNKEYRNIKMKMKESNLKLGFSPVSRGNERGGMMRLEFSF